jgi:cyclopropane fatty-acyl-phospholipid synthase-like methyltransferase
MTHQEPTWLEAYRTIQEQWGLTPDWRLIEYLPQFPKGPVLDLGMGKGRNALFFALMGYEVDCIDISTTYVKQCREKAQTEKLAMTAQVADISSYEIPPRRYALIVASKVLQFFRKSDIDAIVKKINAGLVRRGVVFLRVFSLEEFENVRDTSTLELVEPNTYYHRRCRLYQHFFTQDEVLAHFPKLKLLCCMEGVELVPTQKTPRYQWIIDYLGQRTR